MTVRSATDFAWATEGGPLPLVRSLLTLSFVLLGLYVCCRLTGLLPTGALLPPSIAHSQPLQWLDQQAPFERVLIVLVAAGVSVLGLWTLFARLSRRGSPTRDTGGYVHVLAADEQGLLVVENAGIESLVCGAVSSTPGVLAVAAAVRPSGRGMRLTLQIGVLEDVDLRQVGAAARGRALDAIERLVGLEVHDVRVRLEVLSSDTMGRLLS